MDLYWRGVGESNSGNGSADSGMKLKVVPGADVGKRLLILRHLLVGRGTPLEVTEQGGDWLSALQELPATHCCLPIQLSSFGLRLLLGPGLLLLLPLLVFFFLLLQELVFLFQQLQFGPKGLHAVCVLGRIVVRLATAGLRRPLALCRSTSRLRLTLRAAPIHVRVERRQDLLVVEDLQAHETALGCTDTASSGRVP